MDAIPQRDFRPARPRPPLKRFVAWGLIVGPGLPTALDLAHVRITKEPPERIDALTRTRQLLQHPKFEGEPTNFYSGIPADLVVRSDHVLWAWADAQDHEEALTVITQKYLPSVVALLSARNEAPVLLEMLRIAEEDERGDLPDPRSPFSKSGFFGRHATTPLRPEDVKFLERRDEPVRSDECASSAARELSTAIHLFPQSGSTPANLRAVLLHYFFVVELIARKVAYGVREERLILDAQEPVVARGLAGIRAAGTLKQRVKQIHNLSLQLKRLEASFLSDQIRYAAEALQVEHEVLEEALTLAKFRNSRLGHGSTTEAESQELRGWLSLAQRVALTFFRQYVDSLP